MSKLDNIILECANKVLDGKQEKLGDYIDPTKQQIKDLILELIGDDLPYDKEKGHLRNIHATNNFKKQLRYKVEAL